MGDTADRERPCEVMVEELRLAFRHLQPSTMFELFHTLQAGDAMVRGVSWAAIGAAVYCTNQRCCRPHAPTTPFARNCSSQ